MSQAFNAEQFLNVGTDQAMETRRSAVPEAEYTAIIDSVKPKVVKAKDGSESIACDIFWAIDDAALAEKMGLKKVTVRQTIFLDLDANGRLEAGTNKNIALGKLRDAVGLNRAGQSFTIGMLTGQVAKILVTNKPDNDDPTILYDNVKSVTKLAA